MRWFHSAGMVVGASSVEIRPGSETMLNPSSRLRMDESMSSVSMVPCMRIRRSDSVRQYPFEPPKMPNPCRRARPGWLTA